MEYRLYIRVYLFTCKPASSSSYCKPILVPVTENIICYTCVEEHDDTLYQNMLTCLRVSYVISITCSNARAIFLSVYSKSFNCTCVPTCRGVLNWCLFRCVQVPHYSRFWQSDHLVFYCFNIYHLNTFLCLKGLSSNTIISSKIINENVYTYSRSVNKE